MGESFLPARAPEDNQPQPYSHPVDGIDEALSMQDANDWLDNMIDIDNDWLPHIAEDEASVQISKPTDPSMAQSTLHKGCKCPAHQEIYNNWPTQDAELTIAQCMKTSLYCGNNFRSASEVRRHLRRMKYSLRNLMVYQEIPGKLNRTTPPGLHGFR